MDSQPWAGRRERLRETLTAEGLTALLVTRAVNVRYLSGFTGSSGALLVCADGRALLATDGRYAEQAQAQAHEVEPVITRDDGWLREHLAHDAAVGLEGAAITWERLVALRQILDGRRVVRTAGLVEGLRAVKDAGELTSLQQACAVTAGVMAAVPEWLGPGFSEGEIARRILHELLAAGADDRAFSLIVAAGPNTAKPHHHPGERVVRRGDLVQLDIGAVVDGYHADMSRVFAVGTVDPQLREIHAVVAAAQRAGRARVADGVTAGTVDAACRDVITEAGYGEQFVHPSGHAIGLEIHEEPILRQGSAARLRTSMAVTVEPGIYLPGIGGIRIEDVVVITDTSAAALTQASRDLLVL